MRLFHKSSRSHSLGGPIDQILCGSMEVSWHLLYTSLILVSIKNFSVPLSKTRLCYILDFSFSVENIYIQKLY